ALLVASSGAPLVIPALNRDGDILSDLVLPLFGSIAGSESLLVAFDDDFVPSAVMAEAAHGTAPSLQGKDVANPMAMILPGAARLLRPRGSARFALQRAQPAGLRGCAHPGLRRPARLRAPAPAGTAAAPLRVDLRHRARPAPDSRGGIPRPARAARERGRGAP